MKNLVFNSLVFAMKYIYLL